MLPKINPVTTDAWKKLQQHHEEIKAVHLRELFQNDRNVLQLHLFNSFLKGKEKLVNLTKAFT